MIPSPGSRGRVRVGANLRGSVAPPHNHLMRRGYAALALLALIWGASFLFIKLAVRDMSPATLVLLRAATGLATLALILAVRRQTPFPAGTRKRLLPFVIMAIFGSALPWFGFGFGELSISSA